MNLDHFLTLLDDPHRRLFTSLNSPFEIQSYLDSIPYSTDDFVRCPARVLRDGKAHCTDGALLAAAALKYQGYQAVLIDLFPVPGSDDDHILAVFKRDEHFGAIAKSNFVGLRFREAVYRSYRELVMSYFNDFFSLQRERSLRYYTPPLRLERLRHSDWLWDDTAAAAIEHRLHRYRLIPVVTAEMIAHLSPLDLRSFQAGMMGVDPAGLFKPPK